MSAITLHFLLEIIIEIVSVCINAKHGHNDPPEVVNAYEKLNAASLSAYEE